MPTPSYEPAPDDAHAPINDPLVIAFSNDEESLHSVSSNTCVTSPAPHDELSLQQSARPSRWSGLLNRITGSQNSEVRDEQDGVFGNLVAKEEPADRSGPVSHQTPPSAIDDDITPPDQPPSYEEASADATPSYWETTILTSGWDDEIVVGDMPVGSVMAFAWSMLVSSAFSYVGFFLTYLFHTSHASRGGSLAGLGLTLMHASYDLMPTETVAPGGDPAEFAPENPNNFEDGAPIGNLMHPTGQSVHAQQATASGHGQLTSNLVFFFGLVIFIKGIWEYLVACRVQSAILNRMHSEEEEATRARQEGSETYQSEHAPAEDAEAVPIIIAS